MDTFRILLGYFWDTFWIIFGYFWISTCLEPDRGGAEGGPGGLNKEGDSMSLTPKCDMFLGIP